MSKEASDYVKPMPCAFCWLWRSVVDVDLVHVCRGEDGVIEHVISFCSSKCQSAFILLTSGESMSERYDDWWGE